MVTIPLYTGSVGFNNVIKPHRLSYDTETGVTALSSTSDVIIDRTGELSSRRGTTSVASGSYHSMFETRSGFYVVQNRSSDSAIYLATVNSSGTIDLTGVRDGLALNGHIAYEKLDGNIYYTGKYNRGVLNEAVSTPWVEHEWPDGESTATFSAMPFSDILTLHSGRFIVAENNEIVFSEYGLYNLTDLTRNRRRYDSEIQMIKSVQTGVFVSDSDAVYFLSGTDPSNWTSTKVLNYPAIRYGCLFDLVNPMNIGFDSPQLACVFSTVKGIVVGFQDGSVVNLVERNVKMPDGCYSSSGSIMVVDETAIIQSGV